MNKFIGVLLVIWFLFCIETAAAEVRLVDGIYEGECSFIKVQVTVSEGQIADIVILEHGGGGEKYKQMIEPLQDEIIETQTIDVDAISGATVSSENFKRAVDNALQKSLSEEQ
ncbi:MAG: FMN-binding protein [Candidatus Omnitrophica bacterium]|nr:FMN-binding protein [Candidatus Omnitrophota bacterium]